MDLASLAASAVKKISLAESKNVQKKHPAKPLPDVQPTVITGECWQCGFAMREVMPDSLDSAFYVIAGHGPGRKAEGVHDPLTVRAMWIGTENGGIVHVCADFIGLTNTEVLDIRRRLEVFSKVTNCKAINVSCTHSHGSFDTVGYWGKLPKTGKVPAYMERIAESVKEVCIEAYENRKDGVLSVGTAHVPGAQYLRRKPKVPHDTLTRIKFAPDDGSEEIWFLNFAAHPNTLGGSNRLISADYPYYLRETIAQSSFARVLFGVGAIGAVDPGQYDENNWERTRMQGEALAAAALSIDNDRALEPVIRTVTQPLYYPVDNPVLNFLAMLNVMSSAKFACDRGELRMALRSEMSYLMLGDLHILLLPGEEFPPLAYGGYRSANYSATGKGPEANPKPLTEIAGDENLLIFGVTNDMAGYVVPPNEFILNPTKPYLDTATDKFEERHYHETNSLGESAAFTIAEEFAKLAEKMTAAENGEF
ncbi:MAG: hypothetical protein IK118_10420 [Clostridia bacterium]|nr:hypothetical protein [Clostridia bacterium]